MISMLKATKETFSESIEDFKSLNLDDKLLLLAQNSFRSGLVCINVLKKSLKKEKFSDIIITRSESTNEHPNNPNKNSGHSDAIRVIRVALSCRYTN